MFRGSRNSRVVPFRNRISNWADGDESTLRGLFRLNRKSYTADI